MSCRVYSAWGGLGLLTIVGAAYVVLSLLTYHRARKAEKWEKRWDQITHQPWEEWSITQGLLATNIITTFLTIAYGILALLFMAGRSVTARGSAAAASAHNGSRGLFWLGALIASTFTMIWVYLLAGVILHSFESKADFWAHVTSWHGGDSAILTAAAWLAYVMAALMTCYLIILIDGHTIPSPHTPNQERVAQEEALLRAEAQDRE